MPDDVTMLAALTSNDPAPLPSRFRVQAVGLVPVDVLYQCYVAAFSAGDAAFFARQDPSARRGYFDLLQADTPPSLALMDGGLGGEAQIAHNLTYTQTERLVGFCYVLPSLPPNCHLSCLCIDPAYQGQGLGSALLCLSMVAALGCGYQTMTLRTDSPSARRLYERHSFRVVG